MGRSLVVRWLIFAVSFAMLYGGYTVYRVRRELAAREADSQASQAEALSSSEAAPSAKPTPPADFTLIDQQGQPFSSKSLAGQVWVGSYFFTNCPAVCWRLNQALSGWQQTHPQSQIRFLSITCDPENDPPEVLTRYAQRFNADPQRWTFLTGDMATIVRLGTETFQVSVEKGTHSDRAFVVDRQGKVRGRFRVTEDDQFKKLTLLLAQLDAETAADESPAISPTVGDRGTSTQDAETAKGATGVDSARSAKE